MLVLNFTLRYGSSYHGWFFSVGLYSNYLWVKLARDWKLYPTLLQHQIPWSAVIVRPLLRFDFAEFQSVNFSPFSTIQRVQDFTQKGFPQQPLCRRRRSNDDELFRSRGTLRSADVYVQHGAEPGGEAKVHRRLRLPVLR